MGMKEELYRLMTEVKYLRSKDFKDYAKEKGYTISENIMTNMLRFAATQYGISSNDIVDKLDSLKRNKEVPVEQKEIEAKKMLNDFLEEMAGINIKLYQLLDIMCKPKNTNDPETLKNDLVSLTKLFDYDISKIDEMFLHSTGMPAPDELLPKEYVGSDKYKEVRSNSDDIMKLHKELKDYLSENQPVNLPDLLTVDDLIHKCEENHLPPIPNFVLGDLVEFTMETVSTRVVESLELLTEILEEQKRRSACLSSKEDVEFIKKLQDLRVEMHEGIKSFVDTINNGTVEVVISLAKEEGFDKFIERMKNVFDLSDEEIDYTSRFADILRNASEESEDEPKPAKKSNKKKAQTTKQKKASSGSNDIDKKLSAFIDI